jgi:hypothetical protein
MNDDIFPVLKASLSTVMGIIAVSAAIVAGLLSSINKVSFLRKIPTAVYSVAVSAGLTYAAWSQGWIVGNFGHLVVNVLGMALLSNSFNTPSLSTALVSAEKSLSAKNAAALPLAQKPPG